MTARDLTAQIEQAKEAIAGWDAAAGLLIGVATAVGVLGAGIALLQQLGAKRRWCAVSIAVVGFVISALTIFSNNYFEGDHKTYRKQAHMARRYIGEAERYVERLNKEEDVEAKRALLAMITDKIAGYQQLEDKLLDTGNVAHWEPTAIASAYAQALPRPVWTMRQQAESATAYRFVGTGVDRSLPAAQAQSLQDAQSNASRLLSIPVDSVKRYARTVDSYTEYDSAQRVYRHSGCSSSIARSRVADVDQLVGHQRAVLGQLASAGAGRGGCRKTTLEGRPDRRSTHERKEHTP